MSDKLKPCPFCQCRAEVRHDALIDSARVECIGCYASTHIFYSIEAAIAAWNQRHERVCRRRKSDFKDSNGQYMVISCTNACVSMSEIKKYCRWCGGKVVVE